MFNDNEFEDNTQVVPSSLGGDDITAIYYYIPFTYLYCAKN